MQVTFWFRGNLWENSLCCCQVMSCSIPSVTIPPGHPRAFAQKKFPAPGHLTVNFFPAPGHLTTPGIKNGGKDVLWPMSLVTKGRFSLQPRPQFKLLWRENIRHLVFCLSDRQRQILEKLFTNFETKTSK